MSGELLSIIGGLVGIAYLSLQYWASKQTPEKREKDRLDKEAQALEKATKALEQRSMDVAREDLDNMLREHQAYRDSLREKKE